MNRFETGTVKFFAKAENKRFGFLVLPDGGEIFFHFNDARHLEIKGSEIQFINQISRWHRVHRDPQSGDLIVFQRGWSQKGDKASPWTFESELNARQQELDSRPLYRVYVQYTVVGNPPDEPRLEWEGHDLNDPKLTSFWNPKYDRGNFSNGDLDIIKWFEVQIDGEWKKCSDPRSGKIQLY